MKKLMFFALPLCTFFITLTGCTPTGSPLPDGSDTVLPPDISWALERDVYSASDNVIEGVLKNGTDMCFLLENGGPRLDKKIGDEWERIDYKKGTIPVLLVLNYLPPYSQRDWVFYVDDYYEHLEPGSYRISTRLSDPPPGATTMKPSNLGAFFVSTEFEIR